MHKLFVLTRVNFRAMLSALHLHRSKAGTLGSTAALLILSALALYLSGMYSFLFGAGLAALGIAEYLLPLMALIGVLAGLMFTFASAGGIVFGGRDADLLLSLPVSAFVVMLSKMLALYLENLVFVGLWMLPACAAHAMYAEAPSAALLLRSAVYILFLPLVSTLLGTLGGFLSALAASRVQRKALWMNLMYLLFFGVIFSGSFWINDLPSALLQNRESVQHTLDTWLILFGLMMRPQLWAMLVFAILCAVPFLAVAYLLCLRYKAILSGLSARLLRTDYRLTHLGAQGAFLALYKKETGRYFGSPVYVFNTLFGGIIAVGASAAALIFQNRVQEFLSLAGGLDAILPQGAFGGAAIFATICTTAVSISLEGKSIWILKSAPLPPRILFGAKAAFNLTLSVPCTLISAALLSLAVGVRAADAVCITLFWLSVCVMVTIGGLWSNLLFPKLDSPNDVYVVKQSLSAFIGIFGGMAAVGAAYLVYTFPATFGVQFSLNAFCLALAALFSALSFALWHLLLRAGARRFSAL